MSGWRACKRARVGLGLEDQDRDVEVVADQAGAGVGTAGSGACDRGAPAGAAAVHQEAVVDVHERVHGVDVGDQTTGRLRLAGGDQALGLQPAEHHRRVVADRLAGLGEHVVRVAVTGMGERPVPHGIAARRQALGART